jgi:hypothetical protein
VGSESAPRVTSPRCFLAGLIIPAKCFAKYSTKIQRDCVEYFRAARPSPFTRQRLLELNDHQLGLQRAHARMALDQAGFVLEALLDTNRTFGRRASDEGV